MNDFALVTEQESGTAIAMPPSHGFVRGAVVDAMSTQLENHNEYLSGSKTLNGAGAPAWAL